MRPADRFRARPRALQSRAARIAAGLVYALGAAGLVLALALPLLT